MKEEIKRLFSICNFSKDIVLKKDQITGKRRAVVRDLGDGAYKQLSPQFYTNAELKIYLEGVLFHKPKTNHILFGSQACDIHSEHNSIEDVINEFVNENVLYDVVKFTENQDDVLDLLGNYEGWEGYREITEFEYNKLLKNKQN